MLSDFLSEHQFQHVAPEIAGTAKELFFAPCESDSRSLFSLDERNIAHKVRDLKKPVFVRPHILREIPCVAISRRHGLVDEVCDGGLTTIVVHFYPVGCGSRDIRGIKELGDAGLELFDDLLLGGYEFLPTSRENFPTRRHDVGLARRVRCPSPRQTVMLPCRLKT